MAIFTDPIKNLKNTGTEPHKPLDQSIKRLWEQALTPLRSQLPKTEFETWLSPMTPVAKREGNLEVAVPNRMFASWIEQNYLSTLNTCWTVACGKPGRLKLTWEPAQRQGELFLKDENRPLQTSLFEEPREQREGTRPVRTHRRRGLIGRYDFQSFVVGPSNQFARAAAEAVAGQPGTLYNPFFLFGGVGLGKTHLVNAIGNAILDSSPSSRVLFLTADSFTNQLIDSIARNRAQEFKNRMRRVDILILDDVQFLAGRERTQEEFFHIFNALYQNGRQIILTSDKFPNEIRRVEERLCNRFGWGLVADIQSPEVETRVAILNRRAQAERIDLPREVASFIASRIDSNIRDLEGALTRISAYASLNRCEITVSLAAELLAELPCDASPETTLENIENKITVHYGLKPGELRARRRTRKVAEARQLAMYIMRTEAGASFPAIGEFLGGRDHSTVIHACQTVKKRLQFDSRFLALLETVTRRVDCG